MRPRRYSPPKPRSPTETEIAAAVEKKARELFAAALRTGNPSRLDVVADDGRTKTYVLNDYKGTLFDKLPPAVKRAFRAAVKLET